MYIPFINSYLAYNDLCLFCQSVVAFTTTGILGFGVKGLTPKGRIHYKDWVPSLDRQPVTKQNVREEGNHSTSRPQVRQATTTTAWRVVNWSASGETQPDP